MANPTPIAEARIARGFYQADVAKAVGMSLTSYRDLERGRTKNPSINHLLRLARALGTSVDALIHPQLRTVAGMMPRPATKD